MTKNFFGNNETTATTTTTTTMMTTTTTTFATSLCSTGAMLIREMRRSKLLKVLYKEKRQQRARANPP